MFAWLTEWVSECVYGSVLLVLLLLVVVLVVVVVCEGGKQQKDSFHAHSSTDCDDNSHNATIGSNLIMR